MRFSKAGNEAGNSAEQSSQLLSAELEVDQMGKFSIDRIATIGRAPESSIVLNVRSVSRQHARIFFEGNQFWVKDLESANGTLVNGSKVTLQMLKDGDKLCFGEIRSVFHTTVRASGPAPLAKDPLAEIDDFFSDGTPTGGLKGPVTRPCASPEEQHGTAQGPASTHAASVEEELRRKVQALESENALLRDQLRTSREGGSASVVADGPQAENERLRRLVTQLERALADSNLRIRNLQQRLEPSK